MDTFYGIELQNRIEILPAILGSIQAWRAYDAGQPCVIVRSRPDIIGQHLGGSTQYSNVPQLAADLAAMETTAREPGELDLREVRYVEHDRIPVGIFAPARGWPLRTLVGFVRLDVELGAAIALAIYRSYTRPSPNTIAPEGELLHEVLPHFAKIYRRELPSFIGNEPDISILGRIREARKTLAAISTYPTSDERDDDTEEAGAALEAQLVELANDVDLGPILARVLATQYTMSSPWR
jgi:hypothetical protein